MKTGRQFIPIQRKVLRQDLTSQLVVAVFHGELQGGQRLVETDLAARFGVSRTPIREAIGELASLGVVEGSTAGRGAYVRDFGPKQLIEIYQVRAVLEAEASRLAAGRVAANDLAAAQARSRALLDEPVHDDAWSVRALAEDVALHEQIAVGCGNRRLRDEIVRYAKLVGAVREVINNPNAVQEQAALQHLRVLDHLIAGDAQGASRTMREHIESAAVTAVAALWPAETK